MEAKQGCGIVNVMNDWSLLLLDWDAFLPFISNLNDASFLDAPGCFGLGRLQLWGVRLYFKGGPVFLLWACCCLALSRLRALYPHSYASKFHHTPVLPSFITPVLRFPISKKQEEKRNGRTQQVKNIVDCQKATCKQQMNAISISMSASYIVYRL